MIQFITKLIKKFIKRIEMLFKGEIKDIFSFDNWPIAVVLILVILIGFFTYRYIKKRRAAKAEAVAEGMAPPEPSIPPKALLKIWKNFLSEIPGEFRRSILFYQPFVVFGELGTGKSLLIDKYTDWKGQANQFYPSYTQDPLLQIYLGSRMLVQEVPAALLNDTDMAVRDALIALWRPLFRWREPSVIIALNGKSLNTENPDFLKRQAQMIRGKLNILSKIRRRPVKVSIALTHMDQVEGYAELCDFLNQNNIPLKLEFESQDELIDLKSCMESYEEYLALALTTCSAEDYLKILSFFKTVPETFSILSVFCRILRGTDPLSPEPIVNRVSLVSNREGDASVTTPFVSAFSVSELRKIIPLYKHQIAAAAIVLLGLIYFGYGFSHGRYLFRETDRTLKDMQAHTFVENYFTDLRPQLLKSNEIAEDNTWRRILPLFHSKKIKALQEKVRFEHASNIRQFFLDPKLKRYAIEEAREPMLYLLSLYYSTPVNQLGNLVGDRASDWSHQLGYKEDLIRDYIMCNYSGVGLTLPIKVSTISYSTGDVNLQPMMVFFNQVKWAINKSYISKTYLNRMRREAETLIESINQSGMYSLTRKIVELLNAETPITFRIQWSNKKEMDQIQQEELSKFLLFISEGDIIYPPVKDLNLDQLLQNIRIKINQTEEIDATFTFTLANDEFIFSANDWNRLVLRCWIIALMREFESYNKWDDGLIFFLAENEFETIEMNPTNDGSLFFTGKGVIDGRFTAKAFEQEVKPVLLKIPEFLEMLPIGDEEKNRFSGFVRKSVNAYAQNYAPEYTNYYNAFDIGASNLGELRYILTQIQSPISSFYKLLEIMAENTSLEYGDNAYFRPLIEKLSRFAFLKVLMEEHKESMPELETYRAMMGQMQNDLELPGPYVPDNEQDPAAMLKTRLSPAGRICLSILRREEASYFNMVEKWIHSVGIPDEFMYLFMEPIHKTYLLGLDELSAVVESAWDEIMNSEIKTIADSYPFNRTSGTDVQAPKLQNMLHPQGIFWTTYNNYLAPVCIKKGGIWMARSNPMGVPELNEHMLEIINNISFLTAKLMSPEGTPLPIEIYVSPVSNPVKTIEKKTPVVILAYLKTGTSSIFGFYQKKAWEKLELKWWENEISSVGIETSTQKGKKTYKSITAPESPWSFFHLLDMAVAADKNVFIWEVSRAPSSGDSLTAKFEIKNDPWELFDYLN